MKLLAALFALAAIAVWRGVGTRSLRGGPNQRRTPRTLVRLSPR
jgi:hypothetical protein